MRKGLFFSNVSSLNNLYNARAEVNETVVYCRSVLWLQSSTPNVMDLIPKNRTSLHKYNNIFWPTPIGHENEMLLTIMEGLYRPQYYLEYTPVLSVTACELER